MLDDVVGQALSRSALPDQTDEPAAIWSQLRQGAGDQVVLAAYVDRLTALGRRSLAIELVRQMADARQDVPWPLMMLAGLEAACGRHEAALELGHTMRARFPAFGRSAHVIAAALTRLRRFDEAAQILAQAEARTPDAPWLLQDMTALAEARGDFAAMLDTAERWRGAAPDRPQAAAMVVQALTGLQRFESAARALDDAVGAFPAHPAVLRSAAALAEAHGDVASAFARWAELCDSQPGSRSGHIGLLTLARRSRRPDLLGDRLRQAVDRFPDDREVLTQAASLAETYDWREADRLWRRLGKSHPGDAEIALHAATVMMGVRQDRPTHIAEVLRRLEDVHARFPRFVPAYVSHLEAYRLLGRLDEAAVRAAEWVSRFPNDTRLALAQIAVIEERGAYEEAVTLVEALRGRGPLEPELEAAYARVLSRAGRHVEAEAACRTALDSFPADGDLLCEHAHLATRRADWPNALARWDEAQRRRPHDRKVAEEIRLLQRRLAGEEIGQASGDLGPLADDEATRVFARFESLGGTAQGCEFGMVQSRFGSRHVGLLRWTRIDLATLTQVLENEFDGVGEARHTKLSNIRVPAGGEAYVTLDTRFGMASNTCVSVADAPADRVFVQSCRRLRFLRGKLIEDLTAAEKIFVFKVAQQAEVGALRRLFCALRRYGQVNLLCVLQADASHRARSVGWLEPGLLLGYVDHFMEAETQAKGIRFEAWKQVILQADSLFNVAPVPPR